ncbi:16S rRNA (guanine(966)-N(2))-methyltransferase RsmD [Endozoicomonadaceae bacterium StTr2]
MKRRGSGQRRGTSTGSPQQSRSGGLLRIIAGEWRSRKLPVASVEGLRPTPDRVRETIFNWLMADVPGARCLDGFAGSGALGLEALSRGAARLVALEFSKPAAQQLSNNLRTLSADNASLHQTDAVSWLDKKATEVFDLVFLDPPFRKGFLQPVCQKLNDNGWLSQGAKVYIEAESELGQLPVPENWEQLKCKTAGQVSYYLYAVRG